MRKSTFFFLLLFVGFYKSIALDTLVVGKVGMEQYMTGGSYQEIYEDKTARLSIHEILKDSIQNKFQLNTESYNFNKNSSSAYWVKIVVRNSSLDDVHYVLESYHLNTKSLQLYYVDKSGVVHWQETGESITYSKRPEQHKNLLLDIPLPEDSSPRVFYIRVYSNLHSGFDFQIKSLPRFLFYSQTEYYLLGIYYGMLLIMAMYNLIIFLTIKARVHLYYVFYILSGVFASLNEDKLGYQYIWHEFPGLNPVFAYHVTPMLLLLTFTLYAIKFLRLRKRHPKFLRAILISVGVYVFFYVINIFFPLGHYLRLIYVIPFLVIYITSWLSLLGGYKAAKLFTVGCTFILGSVILIQLRSAGLMPGTIFTVYLLNYSLVIESVVLSIALSDRLKIMQMDKEAAQQKAIEELEENKRLQLLVNEQLKEKQLLQEKVNRELEHKVQERTLELKEANEEISRMNELLYADNKKLEINLKELEKSRVMLKGVDFEEFSKIYPDEDSCYKFLSELKWKDNFTCRKCGYNNFCEGQTSFSRRCTKCRYDESPTAYTIFQGIKFPITKAFYILFLFYSSKEKLTSTEISRILFLRQKTCWSFIHKIMEASRNKSVSKKNKPEGWPSLVLD
jgi:two-component system, sensor histidine kinase LadS